MRRATIKGRIFLAVILSITVPTIARAIGRPAIDRIAERIAGRTFVLKETIREPVLSGESLMVPTLTRSGWYHQNPSGDVALASGSRVEVTGVFDYADRGFFLEIARESHGVFAEPINERPRIRVRVLVEAPIDNPEAQAAEAIDLIAKVLAEASAP